MKMKTILTLLGLFFLTVQILHCQEKKSLPEIEKIYLHTDRNNYVLGESLWFKAYSTYAYTNTLFSKSNLLYVELISSEAKIIAKHKIRLEDGLGHGDFQLSDSLGVKVGTYQLRAYTNWNRNFGDDFVFKKQIEIFNVFENKTTKKEVSIIKPTTNQSVKNNKEAFSVQFFPEGGSLLENVKSTVAFKAVDKNGKPLKIRGQIENSNGKVVSSFFSVHNGMGKFLIEPKEDMLYTAKITSIYNNKIKVKLPTAHKEGYLLSVKMINNRNIVTLKTNKKTLFKNPNAPVTLNCTLKGVSYFNGTQPLNNTSLSFALPIINFLEGIYQFTLYDANLKPQSERLRYISKENNLQIDIKTDKKSYKPKEKVVVRLSSKDLSGKVIPASYSMSSIDMNGVKNEKDYTTNISSYFLMESDIRGKIYEPSYYFDKTNSKRLAHLDLLLLTQGWRNFLWKKTPTLKDSLAFLPEKGITISGNVKSLFGNKPKENYNVNLGLTSIKKGETQMFFSNTNSSGNFSFDNLAFVGDAVLMINATNEKGKGKGMLVLDSIHKPLPVNFKRDNSNTKRIPAIFREKIYEKYLKFGINSENTLDEVVIKANKKKKGPPSLFGTADHTFVRDEKTRVFSNMFQFIQFSIPGITAFGNNLSFNRYGGTPYILVDGSEWSPGELSTMNPDDVAKIEAIIGAGVTMFGTRGGNGVLIIYSKEGNLKNEGKKKLHTVTKKIEGFYNARYFYTDEISIDKKNRNNAVRNTLYWNPYFHPNEKGVLEASYLNSEIETTVKITLEGLTANGIPVVLKTYYKIEK